MLFDDNDDDEKVELSKNKPQQIQFERIREGSFNNFDGDLIADSLEKNKDLWDGFVFGRFDYGILIELRDIGAGFLNADTIMLLTTKDRLDKFLALIVKDEWQVNEVGYNLYEGDEFKSFNNSPFRDKNDFWQDFGSSLGKNQVIIRLWWD